MRPGMQFYAEPIFLRDEGPKRGELYVICRDGSVQSVWQPERLIDWTLMESTPETHYYFGTLNDPKPCLVFYHATSEDPPEGRARCG